jgi:hypothetical protein
MIRIGRSPTLRDRTMPPNNTGLTRIAQARLDNTVSRVNKRHLLALEVDGIELHIWNRVRAGRVCTCQQQASNLPIGSTPASISLIEPKVKTQGFRVATFRHGVSYSPNSFGGQVTEAISANQPNKLDQQLDDIKVVAGQETPSEQAEQQSPPGGFTLDEPEATRCGICLGTGRVNGWALHNGMRLILDNSGTVPVTSNTQWSIKPDSKPNIFTTIANMDNTIMWTPNLPPYFKCAYPIIRNNTSPADNVVAEISLDGGTTWVLLNNANLLLTKNIGGPTPIRVRPSTTNLEAPKSEFTHVEIIYDLAKMPKGQMPNVARASSNDFAGPIINSTIELGGDVENIDLYSIIIDSKYFSVWQVTNITRSETSKNQLSNRYYKYSITPVSN